MIPIADLPAFPLAGNADLTGLTIREYFAIHALAGSLANPENNKFPTAVIERLGKKEVHRMFASTAVELADALIAELARPAGK